MNEILQRAVKTKTFIGGDVEYHYRLINSGTFYTIKVYADAALTDIKDVRNGNAKHINKLWKELTGKNACLK